MGGAERAAPGADMVLRPDPLMIRAFWDAVVRPGDTHEVRIPKTRRGGPARLFGTTAGYFTDPSSAVQAVARVTGLDAPAVYVSLNPVDGDLRARADNRLVTGIAATTADVDIVGRRHLLLDLDPIRASETSATDAERDSALLVRDAVRDYLADAGWPDPLSEAMSGNGGALLYRVDLSNDDASTALVTGCLKTLGELFDRPSVHIDQTVYNAARITKLLGTVAAKGDDCPDLGRRWRLAHGILRPDAGIVGRELLSVLAGTDRPSSNGADAGPRFEPASADGRRTWTVAEILVRNGILWQEQARTYGRVYRLDRCLTSTEHADGAAIVEMASGALDYRCHHNSCRGKGWADARVALGLRYDEGPSGAARPAGGAGAARPTPAPWPEPARVLGLPAAPTLDLALFPPELASVALDAAERIDCPPDYVLWPLVASLGGLAGRGVAIRPRQRDDWYERPCFWVANVGDPSTGKSPAQAAGTHPLRYVAAADHERYVFERNAWAAECEATCKKGKHTRECQESEPIEERRFTSDATIEKLADLMAAARGLTLVRDELAGWIGNLNKYSKTTDGDRQFFLECYSGGTYTVDRIKRGTVRVTDLYLNVVGGVQPDKARHIFGEGDDDGFAARFIAAYPEAPSTAREVDRWPDSGARQALNVVGDRLASVAWDGLLDHDAYATDAPPFCRPDPEAGRLWSEWSTALRERLRRGAWDGRLRGRVGKYPGLAARLALLWHLTDWAAGRVSDDALRLVPAETLARVLNVVDGYIGPMDSRVYRAFDRSDAANGGERIARWIVETRRTAPFTVRDIRRHEWSGLADNEPIVAALEWLAAQGWVREADPEQRPGRPTNRYDVNPRVWEVLADAA